MRYAVVIPARYGSSRLPGKPLRDLCGIPMVLRTWRRCLEAVDAAEVHIATDDIRIRDVCLAAGAQVVMTPASCLTGTDRVAEASAAIDADVFINVQGDEPLFNPEDLARLIEAALEHPHDVINGYCEIEDEETFNRASIPKVVMRQDSRLLYMSRAGVPGSKSSGFCWGWRQVCAYAFPRDALLEFSRYGSKTPLEAVEDIEILRFLEMGREVRMLRLSSMSVAVDSFEDIARAEAAIRAQGLE